MSIASDERIVHPASVPELAAIIRAGLRSRVRRFELWCPKRDRVLEVLQVAGRPLAIGGNSRLHHLVFVSGGSRREWQSRELDTGLWVDGAEALPTLQYSCAHRRLSVPGEWLRKQLAENVRRRVPGEATRVELLHR